MFGNGLQVLHDLYQQKQLLQPLQCNHDLRLIRAAAGPSAASMPLADTVNSAEPTPANVCTTSGTLTEQVLVLPGSVSAADIQSAVSGGFSLVLKDMPKRSRAVAAIVDGLEKQLGLPAGANLYYTPAGDDTYNFSRSLMKCCTAPGPVSIRQPSISVLLELHF